MHGMQEVSGSIPLFSTKKALYFVGSTVLFFLLKQKMGAALFRLHRFQTFCRRASDTPDLKQNRYACSVFRADSSMPRPASVSLRWRSFYGRGWITQAALLKTAHRAVFAPSSATGPQLFESTRLASGKVITKQKLQYPVRILEFLVGAGGFEPPKLKSSRFTVCPHWPLGNTPIFYLQSSLTACIFYHLKWHLSTTFSTDFLFFCRSLFSCVLPK